MKDMLPGLLPVTILALIVKGTIVVGKNTIDPVITHTVRGKRALTVTESKENNQNFLILKILK